jgi:hypothetical protein
MTYHRGGAEAQRQQSHNQKQILRFAQNDSKHTVLG